MARAGLKGSPPGTSKPSVIFVRSVQSFTNSPVSTVPTRFERHEPSDFPIAPALVLPEAQDERGQQPAVKKQNGLDGRANRVERKRADEQSVSDGVTEIPRDDHGASKIRIG